MSEALAGKKILLVDDDNDILTSMQAAFEPTGAVIETASNGNKAVEIAEKSQPDVVILDMMLPGRSGFMVLEKIKCKKPRNAKPFVIMITGNPGSRAQDVRRKPGRQRIFHQAGEAGQADRRRGKTDGPAARGSVGKSHPMIMNPFSPA